jgi:hypothetical protein
MSIINQSYGPCERGCSMPLAGEMIRVREILLIGTAVPVSDDVTCLYRDRVVDCDHGSNISTLPVQTLCIARSHSKIGILYDVGSRARRKRRSHVPYLMSCRLFLFARGRL